MKSFKDFVGIKVVNEDKNSEPQLIKNIVNAIKKYINDTEKNGYGWNLDSENFDFTDLYKFYNGDMPLDYFKKYYKDNEKEINKRLKMENIYLWKHIYSDVETYYVGLDDKVGVITDLLRNEVFSASDLDDKDYEKLKEYFENHGYDIYDDPYHVAKFIVDNKLDKGPFAFKLLN